MSARTTEILQEILSLPVGEREELLDRLLAWEPADPKLLDLWVAEAEDRVAAFESPSTQ